MAELKLLEGGIYSVPEAAELVGARVGRVRVWIEGHSGKQLPVIDNQLGKVDGRVAISFTNLMELRFVALFVGAGVKLSEIRKILQEVRNTLAHPHPFATKIVFRTDGRKVVAEIARRNGIEDIYDLRSRNYEMKIVMMNSLKHDVVYDPAGDALAWRPRPRIAPHVIVHRRLSFGHPILKQSLIPTGALAAAVKAEGSAPTVAEMFGVPVAQVREAVKFEDNLRLAA